MSTLKRLELDLDGELSPRVAMVEDRTQREELK